MYKRERLFWERGYVIDYINKTVNIDIPKNLWGYVFDFLLDWWQKTSWFLIFTIVPILIYNRISVWLFHSHDNLYVIALFAVKAFLFYAFLFLLFNVVYILFPEQKRLSDIQMLLEEVNVQSLLLSTWHELQISLVDNREVIIPLKFYVKYKLSFYGECKNELKKIEYDISKKKVWVGGGRVLRIEFKQPTSGKIVILFRGEQDGEVVLN